MKGLKVTSSNKVFYQIVQIGAGANGSHFFRSLLQDLRTHLTALMDNRHKYIDTSITLCDADKVEAKNISNQLFSNEDIGNYKVVALSDRYGNHYGFDILEITEYITERWTLEKLFAKPDVHESFQVIPILVGMVDNNRTRQLLDDFFHSNYLDNLIYIDAGVEGVMLEGTDEEKEQSGFGGQVVTGVKINGKIYLEPVARVYDNIRKDPHTAFPGQSCGQAIVNNPQRSATNKMAAQLANGIMNGLFHNGTIYSHQINFNAQFGGSQPVFISNEVIETFFIKTKKLLNKRERFE